MKQWWRVAAGAAALALTGLFPHLRLARGQEVAPPPRQARPEETVELEVPDGMNIMLAGQPGSRHLRRAGESVVAGGATIVLGKNGNPEEARRLWKEADRGDALRLRVRQSRVTVAIGQPHYPSHIFIETLPAATARR